MLNRIFFGWQDKGLIHQRWKVSEISYPGNAKEKTPVDFYLNLATVIVKNNILRNRIFDYPVAEVIS